MKLSSVIGSLVLVTTVTNSAIVNWTNIPNQYPPHDGDTINYYNPSSTEFALTNNNITFNLRGDMSSACFSASGAIQLGGLNNVIIDGLNIGRIFNTNNGTSLGLQQQS